MITLCSLLFILVGGALAARPVTVPFVFRGPEGGTALPGGPDVSPTSFTLEAAVEFESGQRDDAEIIGLYDGPGNFANWRLGLSRGRGSSFLHFSFRTDWNERRSRLSIPAGPSGSEVVLAVVFRPDWCQLFLNGARVAQLEHGRGALYLPALRSRKQIRIGHRLRGRLTSLQLCNRSLRPRIIKERLATVPDGRVIDLRPSGARLPGASAPPIAPLRPSACGFSICDDPRVIEAYGRLEHGHKRLRTRLVNIRLDDGSRPLMPKAVRRQLRRRLATAFAMVNISFELQELQLNDSTLRQRHIAVLRPEEWRRARSRSMPCDGDPVCGRKCEQKHCWPTMRRNGVCDHACNTHFYAYDSGDCCLPQFANTSCLDPTSKRRIYLMLDQFQARLNLTTNDSLTIVGIQTKKVHDFAGYSLFPWDKHQFTTKGVVLLARFRNGSVIVHEVGHALGLWHTHRGTSVEERGRCSDLCRETKGSLVTGDLCADTPPTPAHFEACDRPHWGCNDDSGSKCAEKTEQRAKIPQNFMSYYRADCPMSFTKQQQGRMHCHIDAFYRRWRLDDAVAPVPLAPELRWVTRRPRKLAFEWLPPLDVLPTCHDCPRCDLRTGVLTQFATSVVLRNSNPRHRPFVPAFAHDRGTQLLQNVVGPPYDEGNGFLQWIPGFSECLGSGCILDFTFQHPVVAVRLALWITISDQNDHKVTVHGGAQNESFTLSIIYEDQNKPITIDLRGVPFTIDKVTLQFHGNGIKLSAVQLESKHQHPVCVGALVDTKYEIHRSPPFSDSPKLTSKSSFIDKWTSAAKSFEYRVRVVRKGAKSAFSLPLRVDVSGGMCGDGTIDRVRGEKCDDGDRRSGDGCSKDCQTEEGFRCTGQPSLCYRFQDDGICENFELPLNSVDCNHKMPPEGFTDQWALTVRLNASTSALPHIAGEPRIKSCRNVTDDVMNCARFWCSPRTRPARLEAVFREPVFAVSILLAISALSVGVRRPLLAIWTSSEAKGPEGWAPVTMRVPVECSHRPLEVPIVHDLTRPLRKVVRVRIEFDPDAHFLASFQSRFALAGIGVRSRQDPLSLFGLRCGPADLVDPFLMTCQRGAEPQVKAAKPKVKNAVVQCKRNKQRILECAVSCIAGFKLAGSSSLRLVRNRWLGSPVCIPRVCPQTRIANAIVHCPQGRQFGASCNIRCRPGAKLIGSTRAKLRPTIRCTEKESWTTPEVFCATRLSRG